MKFGTVFPGANIQLIDKTTEVVPAITLIALVSDAPGTKELKTGDRVISRRQSSVVPWKAVPASWHPRFVRESFDFFEFQIADGHRGQ